MARASFAGLAVLLLTACVTGQVPSEGAEPSSPEVAASEVQPTAPQVVAPRRGTIDISVIDEPLVALAHELVDVALADPRTSAVHEGQVYEVTEVSALGDGLARVVIEFDDPLPPGSWPDEAVCAIYRDSNDITGIAWRISLDSMQVSTYSPQWDYAIACA